MRGDESSIGRVGFCGEGFWFLCRVSWSRGKIVGLWDERFLD